MSKSRFDYVELKAVKTDEGFLIDSPVVARTGILEYRNADGSVRRELRLAEDVFHADSLKSFIGKPITVDHPTKLLSAKDVGMVQVGTMLSAGRQDGEKLRADIVIHQPDKIGERRELSLGYNVDLEETPGEWEGQRYDAVQRNIRVNHLSIVKRARAGAVARLNLDADEEPTNSEGLPMPKIRLDNGLEYEAAPEVVVAIEKLRTDAQTLSDEVKQKTKTVETVIAERDQLKARVDAIPAEIAAAKAAGEAAAKQRVELETVAASFKIDAKDKTDDDIKNAVIKAFNKDHDPTGKSADYINAAFDIAKTMRKDDTMKSQRQTVNSDSQKREDTQEVDYYAAHKKALSSKNFSNKE
jgi:hypothetical protein